MYSKKIISTFTFILFAFVTLIFVGCGSSSSGSSTPQPSNIKQTTVLTYIIGSDLQCKWNSAQSNINEMQSVSSTSNMNVVVQTGGVGTGNGCLNEVNSTVGKSYWDKNNWLGYTDVNRTIEYQGSQKVIQQLGATATVDMGNAQTLTSFIQWGVQNYPAQKYVLVIWDHAGGINSSVGPDTNTSNSISSPDLIKAIKATGVKFEIIGFDACLMGMTEVAAGLSPYANYMVGSEETEPGGGWDYNVFLNYVNSNPTANGAAIGKVIVDSFIAKCAVKVPNMSATLSVIDMSKMNALVSAINNLASSLTAYATTSVNNWINLAYARFSSLDFSTYNLPMKSEVFDYVDLIQFAGKIANIDQTLTNVAEQVISAAQSAIIYSNSSKNGVYGALGLSIYFPSVMPECNATTYDANTSINGTSFFAVNYSGAVNGLIAKYYNFYKNNNMVSTISAPVVSGSVITWNTTGTIIAATLLLDDANGSSYSTQIDAVSNNAITFNISNSSQMSGWTALNGYPALLFASPNINQTSQNNEYLIPVTDSENDSGYLTVETKNNQLYVTGFLDSPTSKNQPLQANQTYTLKYYNAQTNQLATTSNVITIADPNNTMVTTSSFANYTPSLNAVSVNIIDITGTKAWGAGQNFR